MTRTSALATTTRRQQRRSSSVATSSAAKTGRGTRIVRLLLTGLWLVGVPLFAAAHVDRLFGAVWGSIPLFWLEGTPPGPGVAGGVTLLGAIAAAAVLHRQRAIFLLAVLPALVSWIGYVGFNQSVWVGALAGLAAGGIAFAVGRRQGR